MQAILSRYIQPDVLNRVGQQDLTPRQLVEGNLAGAHKSPFHGFAVEFAGHREYVPGDDLRHLDWKVYYRRDKLATKQYEMETNLVCHVLLDVSASMRYGQGDQRKLLYASRVAATLGYLVIERSDKAAFAMFDEAVRVSLPPSNSLQQVLRITQALDAADPVHKTALGAPLMELAGRFGRRGIVVILSDFFVDLPDLEKALQRIRYDRHEVVLMQVLHRDEIDFRLPGMVRFVDLEGTDAYLTCPEDVRQGYLAGLNAFNQELARMCEANRCERVVVDTSRPLGELFTDYLQQRARVHRRW